MWKLIWKDSFHRDRESITIMPYYLIIYLNFFNIFSFGNPSEYEIVFLLYFIFVLTIMTIFPIKLAKGLYLCPLSEGERKRYLVIACSIRLTMFMSLFGLILIGSRFFLEADNQVLLLQFCCSEIITLGVVLSSLILGSISSAAARQRYYATKNIPAPQKSKQKQKEQKGETCAVLYMTASLLLALVGVILPMNTKIIKPQLWLYCLPTLIISCICMIVYIKKYLDKYLIMVTTLNANSEVHYLRKKKAGVYNAY
ncbi:MAG TPA: hypothetical protein VJZ06_01915 [Mobilitalea sp.]|nr:hypothetical protein [Mobilitalea sp.]